MGMRVVMVSIARVRMRPVPVLVRAVTRLGLRVDSRRARVAPLWTPPRVVGAGGREREHARDEADDRGARGARHGFFFGGAPAIFFLSAASSSSTLPPGLRVA